MKSSLLFFLGILPVAVFAQAEDAHVRTFRILNFLQPAEGLLFDAGRQKTSINAYSCDLSAPYPCLQSKLSIYREVPPPATAVPGTSPTREEVVAVDIPQNYLKSIVILAPVSPDNPKLGKAWVMEDRPQSRPPGSLFIYNISSLPMAMGINKKVAQVAPGETSMLTYGPLNGAVHLIQAVQYQNAWATVMNQDRLVDSTTRLLGVVIDAKPEHADEPPAKGTVIFEYVSVTDRMK